MRHAAIPPLSIVPLLIALAACNTNGETPGLGILGVDLTGDWVVAAPDILESCGGVPITTISGLFQIQQDGDSLFLARRSGGDFCTPLTPWGTGTVEGARISLVSGRVVEISDTCILQITETDVGRLGSSDSMTGRAMVEVRSAGSCASDVSCTFESTFTATRIVPGSTLLPEWICAPAPW